MVNQPSCGFTQSRFVQPSINHWRILYVLYVYIYVYYNIYIYIDYGMYTWTLTSRGRNSTAEMIKNAIPCLIFFQILQNGETGSFQGETPIARDCDNSLWFPILFLDFLVALIPGPWIHFKNPRFRRIIYTSWEKHKKTHQIDAIYPRFLKKILLLNVPGRGNGMIVKTVWFIGSFHPLFPSIPYI
jgi:hypothetical protein